MVTFFVVRNQTNLEQSDNETVLEEVVINEAVRTLLYLPLYHAEHRGFFEEEGLDVEIVSAGSATASFASMLSGEADFSQADPMYVPISRQQGSDAIVVAQVVSRIALWGVASDTFQGDFTTENVRGLSIATHPRPMTAYTYAVKALRDIGLSADDDVRLLEVRPGGELAALISGEAEIAFTLEPGTSIAVSQGGRVVVSFPEILEDQVFTALMTTSKRLGERPEVVRSVVRAYERALNEITSDPASAMPTAVSYFPNIDPSVLEMALERLVRENVYSANIMIPVPSWERAMGERIRIGDLEQPLAYKEGNIDVLK